MSHGTTHRTDPQMGVDIERLGRAVARGEIDIIAAVTALQELDPALDRQGARMQLKAWTTARTRYQAAATARDIPVQRPADARSLGDHAPIHFRRPA
jgi:hypothetical protein